MLLSGDLPDFDAMFILDGVHNGFRVTDPGAEIPLYDCGNYKSCYNGDNALKMNNIMLVELSSGKLSKAATKPDQIHSLGAIPKPNGSVRHITDCSIPDKSSVNNFMKCTFSSFSFNTIDDVVTSIKPCSYMATVDLQDAYRSVPIYPDDRRHFGLCWDFGNGPIYLTDNFLCFGSKCSAFIFNRLTDAVARFMTKQGYTCYNYLDDFIIIESSYERAITAQLYSISTLRKLGFYISWKKTASPTQYCRFLGIDIDSVEEKLLLPEEKIIKFHKELDFWENRKTATKLQLQRLCGILNFCCKVVRGGRIYMYHMIQLLKLFNVRKRIILPLSFHEDIAWWRVFAESFNGQADFFNPVDCSVELYTDACLSGLAAICQNDFYQAKICCSLSDEVFYQKTSPNAYDVYIPLEHIDNINVLELVAIWLAFVRWSYIFNNCRVIAYCDNLQACYNLAKDKTRNALSNRCLRYIFWLCVKNNIYISPVYIPSRYNSDADYLSRTVNF